MWRKWEQLKPHCLFSCISSSDPPPLPWFDVCGRASTLRYADRFYECRRRRRTGFRHTGKESAFDVLSLISWWGFHVSVWHLPASILHILLSRRIVLSHFQWGLLVNLSLLRASELPQKRNYPSSTIRNGNSNLRFSHYINLLMPKACTSFGRLRFQFAAPRDWNRLQQELKLSRALCDQ